jgi:ribosomal protein L31
MKTIHRFYVGVMESSHRFYVGITKTIHRFYVGVTKTFHRFYLGVMKTIHHFYMDPLTISWVIIILTHAIEPIIPPVMMMRFTYINYK